MLPNHVMGNSWGPIEYRETGLYNFDQKLPSIDVVKSMSCFSDFNHNPDNKLICSYDKVILYHHTFLLFFK